MKHLLYIFCFSVVLSFPAVAVGIPARGGLSEQPDPKKKEDHRTSADLYSRSESQDSIVPPRFLGGDAITFSRWVGQRIHYPKSLIDNNIQGHVVLQLAVDSTGAVSYVKTIETKLRYGPRTLDANSRVPDSPGLLFVNEVLRVVRLAPRWTPGLCNGKPTEMFILLPAHFHLY